jgi:ABC-type glycerol-3-phosphate transport system permease component
MQVPNDLWDSAQIDGAGHIRYLVQIMLPLSRAAVMTLILFGFIGSWNALAWPILVTTTPAWRPISYGMFAFIDEAGAQFNLQMAGAVITMLPVIVLYFFTQRTFIEGIATTGLKG